MKRIGFLIAGYTFTGLIVAAMFGCSYPVAEPMNMELISSLRTALSTRNDKWLAENEAIVEQRHEKGEMRDDEYEAFRSIIQRAREGDWQGAERASVRFQKAQRPTQQQIEQVSQFQD